MSISHCAIPRYTAPLHSHAYCLQLLRNYDHENFIANLLHPAKHTRKAHAAIRAFNVELVNVRANVSNEDLGRLRIQFFRDALNSILSVVRHSHSAENPKLQSEEPGKTYDNVYKPSQNEVGTDLSSTVPGSPVMEALAEAISSNTNVEFGLLHDLIDAREQDLGYPMIRTLTNLEEFAIATQGKLIHVHSQLLSDSNSLQLSKVSRLCGGAVGLAVLLRGAPAHATSRLSYMPQELSQHYQVSTKELLDGTGNSSEVFKSVADKAQLAIDEAKSLIRSDIPKAVQPAFWPMLMAEIYLRRLKKVGFNPFDPRLQQGLKTTYPLQLQFKLLRARLMGT